ncbi:hypothetical protein Esi_0420_0013 [Ectocarpus siliculosus]|uniref:Uncharacterized protein n=1 Tax=Ectocarpus siliculosus TaxID=2880 RepID=D7G0Z7_ECTSI|nr:hypothetical protein Esi_0420_0013 [Ectocarpus siliculosus]|eukprot:CBJ33107.1 hypothetical protein Esi_0420_0013 [Ectocarpus siliculosus]
MNQHFSGNGAKWTQQNNCLVQSASLAESTASLMT